MDSKDGRQKSILVEERNLLCSWSSFPGTTLEPGDDANGDVVHHESEQCLVGVVLCLEEAWNGSPDGSAYGCSEEHDQKKRHMWKLGGELDCKEGSENGSCSNLAFTSDVPESHLETRCDCQCTSQKRDCRLDGLL